MAKRLRQSLNGDRDAAVYDWLVGASALDLSRRYRCRLDHIDKLIAERRADLERGTTVEAIQRMEAVLAIELAKVEDQRREHETLRPKVLRVTKHNSWWFGREAHLSSAATALRDQRIRCIEARHRMQHGDRVTVTGPRPLQDVLAATRRERGLPEIDFSGVRS